MPVPRWQSKSDLQLINDIGVSVEHRKRIVISLQNWLSDPDPWGERAHRIGAVVTSGTTFTERRNDWSVYSQWQRKLVKTVLGNSLRQVKLDGDEGVWLAVGSAGVAAAQSNRFRYSRDPEDRMAVGASPPTGLRRGNRSHYLSRPRKWPEREWKTSYTGMKWYCFGWKTSPRPMLRGHSPGKNRAEKYQAVTCIPPPLLFGRGRIWCITRYPGGGRNGRRRRGHRGRERNLILPRIEIFDDA